MGGGLGLGGLSGWMWVGMGTHVRAFSLADVGEGAPVAGEGQLVTVKTTKEGHTRIALSHAGETTTERG